MKTRIVFGAVLGLTVVVVFVSLQFRVEAIAQQAPQPRRQSQSLDPYGSNSVFPEEPMSIGEDSPASDQSTGGTFGTATSSRQAAGSNDEFGFDPGPGISSSNVGNSEPQAQQNKVRIIRLKKVSAVGVANVVRALFRQGNNEPQWFLSTEDVSNSLIFKGSSKVFEQVSQIAGELDRLAVEPDASGNADSDSVLNVVHVNERAVRNTQDRNTQTENSQVRIIRLRSIKAAAFLSIVQTLFADGLNDSSLLFELEPGTNSVVMRGSVDELDQVEKLAEQLDTPAASVARSNDNNPALGLPPGTDGFQNELEILSEFEWQTRKTSATQPQQLQEKIAQADKESVRLAGELRRMEQHYGKQHPKLIEARTKLDALLDDSFDLRLQLQEIEIAVIRRRLQQIESRVQQRAQLRQQIIDRRLGELLGEKSDLDWEITQTHQPDPNVEVPIVLPSGNALQTGGNFGLPQAGPTRLGVFVPTAPSNPTVVPATAPNPVPEQTDERADTARQASPAMSTTNASSQLELIEAEHAIEVAKLKVQKLDSRLEQLKESSAREDALYDLRLAELELEQSKRLLDQKRRLIDTQRQSLNVNIRYLEKNLEAAKAEYEQMLEVIENLPGTVSATEVRKQALEVQKAELHLQQAISDLAVFDIQNQSSGTSRTTPPPVPEPQSEAQPVVPEPASEIEVDDGPISESVAPEVDRLLPASDQPATPSEILNPSETPSDISAPRK